MYGSLKSNKQKTWSLTKRVGTVRGTEPRIRISTEMSRIRSTETMHFLHLQRLPKRTPTNVLENRITKKSLTIFKKMYRMANV
jgi:hypothetical protein